MLDLADNRNGRLDVLKNSHLSLKKKHGLISLVHSVSAYRPDEISARARQSLDVMIAVNTRRADTVVDVTDDGVGLSALQTMLSLAEDVREDIDLRAAVYSPLGFRDDEPRRWALFEQGAEIADFIGCLPERDDRHDYPDHIGYEECCERMIDLAKRSGKFLHVHTDQINTPAERGTERLLEVLRGHGALADRDGAPLVWAIHAVSPSTYDEDRWQRLVAALKDLNVGIVCCPSGALGMRQLRGIPTPTYNSIARVLDLCAAGIPVRLASDNVADMLSPSTTADLTDEVFLLSACLRFYDVEILSRLACGQPLGEEEIASLKMHLEENDVEMAKSVQRWQG